MARRLVKGGLFSKCTVVLTSTVTVTIDMQGPTLHEIEREKSHAPPLDVARRRGGTSGRLRFTRLEGLNPVTILYAAYACRMSPAGLLQRLDE